MSARKYSGTKNERQRQASRAHRDRIIAYITSYKVAHPCVDCGETDAIVLEFDHVRGEKRFAVAHAIASRLKLDDIKAEIKKCVVRCANCHRRMTYKRKQSRAVVQLELPLVFPKQALSFGG